MINPFWSERVQDEARLQAARPDFLGRILEDGGERGSRAIEPAPTGPPRSFGPLEQGAQVRSSSEPTRETASRAAAAHDHPREGQTAGFGIDQARGESIGSDSVEGESSGLRPGERLILTEMKDLLKSLYRQNDLLCQRMEKLEEDMLMQSASSGDIPEGERHTTAAAEIQAPGPSGLSRRDLSPPPPPPPLNERVATTPGGTLVPLGTPPITPPGTPRFGPDRVAVPASAPEGPRSFGIDGFRSSEELFSPLQGFGSAQAYGLWNQGVASGQGFSGPSLNQSQGFSGFVQGPESGLSGVLEGSREGRSGRDPFIPGDRTWWKLPTLPEPGAEDSCIEVTDWVTQVRPIMSDLSDRSSVWWERVTAVAHEAYGKWQRAGPLEKSMVECQCPPDLADHRYSRLEARALGMLLESLPVRIKDELIATKGLSCANALYRILLAYQPGGLGERQRLIQNLTDPGQATTAKECSDKLRRWHRWLHRSQDLHISTPDAAILLSGLDKLCAGIMGAHSQLNFRCSIARTQHQLDFCPAVGTVTAYARLLQAEMETLALSGQDKDVGISLDKGKRARVAAMRQDEPKGGPKGGGKDNSAESGGNAEAKGGGKEKGGKGNAWCKFYLTKEGCRHGRTCKQRHDYQKAAAEARCFNCGNSGHRQDQCRRPKGEGKGKTGEGRDQGSRGESSASSANASADNSQVNQNQSPMGEKGSSKGSGKEAQPQVRQAAAEASARGATAGSSVQSFGESSGASGATSQQEFFQEAAKLLKGFRIAACRVPASEESLSKEVYVREVQNVDRFKDLRGLLDGGATHALRTARDEAELESCTLTKVSLALGSAELYLSPVGTLLSRNAVAPIAPLGALTSELGCRVEWSGDTCVVTHPIRGVLPIVMQNRCPELSASLTEELIRELEDKRAMWLQRALRLRALSDGFGDGAEATLGLEEDQDGPMLAWLRRLSPDCPERILAKVPSSCPVATGDNVPLNRRIRRRVFRAEAVMLHLYSGKTRTRDFGHLPASVYVLSIDLLNGGDMLSDPLYRYLCDLCCSGKVIAIIGGPPCSTVSPLRQRGSWDEGPRVLRAREGPNRFGLACLLPHELRTADEHTILLFRMKSLYFLADGHAAWKVMYLCEQPTDPSEYAKDAQDCPSFWAWPEMESFEKEYNMVRAKFSQGHFGHEGTKPTTVLTNSWKLYTLLHGCHSKPKALPLLEDLESRMDQAKTWAKWPPGFCLVIGQAFGDWVQSTDCQKEERQAEEQALIRHLSKNEKAFVEHCEKDHLGFRKDCNVCLASSVRGHQHFRQKYPHGNALTLTLDLIGPLCQGEDQLGKAKRLLIGVLGVPLFKDGKPQYLELQKGDTDHAIPEEWEDDFLAGESGAEPGDESAETAGPEGLEEPEEDAPAGDSGENPEADLKWKDRAAQWNERWKKTMQELTRPVKIVPVVFVEPIPNKKATTTLKAIQRVYTRIRLLNLGVRRIHTDSGREFANALLEKWALSRDIALTASVPSDPKSNGRIESMVGSCKSAIRGLLLQSRLPSCCWPHCARQWEAQKQDAAIAVLGGPPRKRPLVPSGTKVVVKRREWTQKTPWTSKTVEGIAVAPSVRVPGATIVRIPAPTEDNPQAVTLYIAPVVYTEVKTAVQFEGVAQADLEEAVPMLAPGYRVRSKTSVLASDRAPGESVQGEQGQEGSAGSGAVQGSRDRKVVPGQGQGLGIFSKRPDPQDQRYFRFSVLQRERRVLKLRLLESFLLTESRPEKKWMPWLAKPSQGGALGPGKLTLLLERRALQAPRWASIAMEVK